MSNNELVVNTLYCVSLRGYTWQCGLKYARRNLQTLRDKDMLLLLELINRGGIGSFKGERYVKSDESKNILFVDANKLFGWA